MTPAQEIAAQVCVAECAKHIAAGENEATLRSVFTSHLRSIAGTPTPWWAEEHVVRTEAALGVGRAAPGFADNLVGLTAIEYERNLRVPAVHAHGLEQVHDYVAGLLNRGENPSSVRGVLSDTVVWEAYRVVDVSPTPAVGAISRHDITLGRIARIDCNAADLAAARQLHQFLVEQLGRDGGQVLTSDTLYTMLGATSAAGTGFATSCEAVVDAAFAAKPDYAAMVQHLWANFVSFVGTTVVGVFDRKAYVHELYLLTLGKLIAANVLDQRALVSAPNELEGILDGRYFEAQGLTNLVEYDYFGWLARPPHVAGLVTVAREMQAALKAYDFSTIHPEDLFGRLVAQMAEETQRVLLGQEPTPAWLVSQVVDAVDARQPEETLRHYVDPCCGSGAFIAAVVEKRAKAVGFLSLSREARGQLLCETIAGFDIDPLAVMLAKVSWLVAARPALDEFNSGFPTSIPIYHADSLFATAPLSGNVVVAATGDFVLRLDTHSVTLPRFLTSPNLQAFFDEYSIGLYAAALAQARTKAGVVSGLDVSTIRRDAEASSNIELVGLEVAGAETFGLDFARAMTTLERTGRNGLWLYMLRNGYRPAMVRGRYNGVVTNFPWLALSKLADNPYKATLHKLTVAFNIEPATESAPHLELATIFFLHAAEHYLGAEGAIGAVVPNSVLQGAHHTPFRAQAFQQPPSNLQLQVREVWTVEKAFSTNAAAVVLATKPVASASLEGGHSDTSGVTRYPLYLSTLGNRNSWTRFPIAQDGHAFYESLQGADVMPRTTWFHELTPGTGPKGIPLVQVDPIVVGASPLSYLIQLASLSEDFACTPGRRLKVDWQFPVLTSAHIVQFNTNTPANAILPLKPRSGNNRKLAAATFGTDRVATAHFKEIISELNRAWRPGAPWSSSTLFEKKLNFRNKLTAQRFSSGQNLVLVAAGGKHPCASSFRVTTATADRLVIDQTIYWFEVRDNDERDFVVGVLNSEALAMAIRPFQPSGNYGERHVHKLAVQVLPQWNSGLSEHRDVLRHTRALRAELGAAAAIDPKLRTVVSTPTASVAVRRTFIRRRLATLPSYIAYQAACWSIFPPAT